MCPPRFAGRVGLSSSALRRDVAWPTGAAEMLRLMESGRIPDTAFMSMHSLRAKTPKSQCFHFSSSLVDQQRPTEFDPSTTCTLQSWRKALAGTLTSRQKRKTQKSKHNGARARLNAKITRKAVRSVKKAAGEAGGLKRAGNGSSVKNVHKKSKDSLCMLSKCVCFQDFMVLANCWLLYTLLSHVLFHFPGSAIVPQQK